MHANLPDDGGCYSHLQKRVFVTTLSTQLTGTAAVWYKILNKTFQNQGRTAPNAETNQRS